MLRMANAWKLILQKTSQPVIKSDIRLPVENPLIPLCSKNPGRPRFDMVASAPTTTTGDKIIIKREKCWEKKVLWPRRKKLLPKQIQTRRSEVPNARWSKNTFSTIPSPTPHLPSPPFLPSESAVPRRQASDDAGRSNLGRSKGGKNKKHYSSAS